MTDLVLGLFALAFVETNSEFIIKAAENKADGYVWKFEPSVIHKDSLAIAFEGNDQRVVFFKQKRDVEVKLPLPKPKGMK